MTNTLIPNTYQKPNMYSDLYGYYLTAEENVVLDFFVRRILGFEENRAARRDRISLTQICEGFQRRDGTWVTRGTGLSRPRAARAVQALKEFGFIVAVGEPTQSGQEYELVLDSAGINLAGLVERKESARASGRQRTDRARLDRHTSGKTDIPPAVSQSNHQRLVSLTTSGKTDIPPAVSQSNSQNPLSKPTPKPTEQKGRAAFAAPPPPPSKPVRSEDIPPAPAEARKPTPQQAEVGAWGAVMELDISIPANAKRVGNMLTGLRKSKDCQPAPDVATWRFGRTPPPDGSWNFYTHTWQGAKGQPPTEREINAYWGAWLRPSIAVVQGGNTHARAAPVSRTERNRELLDRAMREATGQPSTGSPVIEGRVVNGRTG